MLTAAGLRGATPPRAFRGYDRATVDELLARLADTLEEAETGVAALREREALLRRELEAGQSLDRSIRQTMVATQREIDRLQLETKRESQSVRERARLEALEAGAALEEEHEVVAARLAEVRAIESDLRTRARELVEEALRELAGVAPPPAAEGVTEGVPAAPDETRPVPVEPQSADLLEPVALRPPDTPEPAAPPVSEPEATVDSEDTLTFAVPVVPEEAAAAAEAMEGEGLAEETVEEAYVRSRRRPLVLSFAILLVGALVAVGIWQLSSADGASEATASSAVPGASTDPLDTQATQAAAETETAEPAGTTEPASSSAGTGENALPPAPVAPKAVLVVAASEGDCWLQVRNGSAGGRLLYDGFLYEGDSERFTGKRLWVRFGNPANVTATLGGEPVQNLPAGTGDVLVTAEGLRTVSVG